MEQKVPMSDPETGAKVKNTWLEFECEHWNWKEGDGCWVGAGAYCTHNGAAPGWTGGTFKSNPENVVQYYVSDPVL